MGTGKHEGKRLRVNRADRRLIMGKAYESIKAGLTEVIADAMSKRYPVQLQWSAEDEGWIATFPDLPGCSA